MIIRLLVPATSKWNVLKYSNLFSLLRNNELLGSYRNLYWFGTPIQLSVVELITFIILLFAFLFLFCTTFSYAQLLTSSNNVGALLRINIPLINNKTKGKGLFTQERYKIFFICGIIIILIPFSFFQIYQASVQNSFITADEIYYAYYMNHVAGPVTEENLNWLQSEGEKFTDLIQAQRKLTNGEISQQEYESSVTDSYSLQREYAIYRRVVNKLYYIKEHPGAYFVYDSGYPILFDNDGNQDIQDVLLSAIILSMCSCSIFSIEYSTDMQRVLRATPEGRKRTFSIKVTCSFLTMLFVSFLVIIPRVWVVAKDYGLSAITAPLYSLSDYSTAPASIQSFS